MTSPTATFSLPPFEHSYARLPAPLFSDQPPTAVAKPSLIQLNEPLAEVLNIDINWLNSPQGIQALAGNDVPATAKPIAMAYSGHQFGSWNPTLGDGRAILLGEVMARDGVRYDVQLKGAGQTPYSRQGDGRSPLGPALREYIVSEAMAALGIATTRSLAVISSGEQVAREQWLPGGILTRVAKSHIRIGTFEYASYQRDDALLKQLADYTLERLFANCQAESNPYLAMLNETVKRLAELVAQWQAIGFVHGVMNTDNMLLSGETIDYGPCAFLDNYHQEALFSSIDQNGRYAYKNQPGIAQWNCLALAQAMLPLLGEDEPAAIKNAQQAIESFPPLYEYFYADAMAKKLGFATASEPIQPLIDALLGIMQNHQLDYTLTFSRLTDQLGDALTVEQLFADSSPEAVAALQSWSTEWQQTLQQQAITAAEATATMQANNPLYIPRNHLVEAALHAAVYDNDLKPFYQLIGCLNKPFQRHPDHHRFATPPKPEQVVKATFCGT